MKKPLGFLLTLVGLLTLVMPGVVHADVNNFTITDFAADYYLGTGDRQGTLKVDEQLSVNFSDYNHGLLRAIPNRYNGQSEHLKVLSVSRDGNSEPYSSYTSNDNQVLKIGDASRTVTGTHLYRISYQVENVIRFSGSHNELIWNTNGTQWTQPFTAETARLHVPASMADKQTNVHCYTGQFQSTGSDCTVARHGADTVFRTTRTLQAGETMTFATSFPQGTFTAPTAADWWHDNGLKLVAVVVPVLWAATIGYRKWHRDGKDSKGRGTIIPEYTAPKGVNPALADAVLHYQLTNKGLSATIIALAIRKHLKIVESDSAGLLGFGKHKEYRFEKLELASDPLQPHEQLVWDGLFEGRSKVATGELKGSFYKTVEQVKADVEQQLLSGGYVPRSQSATYLSFLGWIIGFLVLLGITAKLWPFFALGLGGGVAIFVLFTLIMPKRTQLGVATIDNLEGLKLYMDTAEKDRLAMLQSVDAPYAEDAGAPQKTVQLFEKLLPYAIVLGVEQSWAKQFEGIYTTPPDWYGGNWAAFNAGYLVSSLGNSMQAMNTAFAAPSSGGSGAGGGFSGGGGGGGGGGGW